MPKNGGETKIWDFKIICEKEKYKIGLKIKYF